MKCPGDFEQPFMGRLTDPVTRTLKPSSELMFRKDSLWNAYEVKIQKIQNFDCRNDSKF